MNKEDILYNKDNMKGSKLLLQFLKSQQEHFAQRSRAIHARIDDTLQKTHTVLTDQRLLSVDLYTLADRIYIKSYTDLAFNTHIDVKNENVPTQENLTDDEIFARLHRIIDEKYTRSHAQSNHEPMNAGVIDRCYLRSMPVFGTTEYQNFDPFDLYILNKQPQPVEEEHSTANITPYTFSNIPTRVEENENFGKGVEEAPDFEYGKVKSRRDTFDSITSGGSRHRPTGGVNVFSEQVEDQLRERSLSGSISASAITSPKADLTQQLTVNEVKPVVEVENYNPVSKKSAVPVKEVLSIPNVKDDKLLEKGDKLGFEDPAQTGHLREAIQKSRPAPARRNKGLKPTKSIDLLSELTSSEKEPEVKSKKKSLFEDEKVSFDVKRSVKKSLFDDDDDDLKPFSVKSPTVRRKLFGDDDLEVKPTTTTDKTRKEILKSLFDDEDD